MATKTVTRTELIDDLDGGRAERTIAFSFDGMAYEIDLSKRNAAAFDKALKPYVEAARKLRRHGVRARRAGSSTGRTSGRDLAAVREWARANGYSVSDRGRVPAAVIAAYDDAH